ncbi:MAG TPA: undecaprenyldiphospho-muramoylpentapeptide beta-N-acetylglucosaminyltransferase [Bryobacteraceae bacterium]|nr:undecaprenyldiphospho-muramoylpentapeptide beta-N-acetylglucosaminyltransferase [Bryobacteraceae bacterium]
MATVVMAGGGTGGHVMPLLAVARVLQADGHQSVFIGTRTGFEAKLVPPAGFPIEFIEIGGLNRVGAWRKIRSLAQLPLSVLRSKSLIEKHAPSAVFSLGGYAAGPVVLAALWKKAPLVVMEPNAMPGLTNRKIGRYVRRALLSFSESARYFPPGKSEITGLPVRAEFFRIPPKPRDTKLTILITGGSQGSRTLNNAASGSWKYFRENQSPVRFIHQTGTATHGVLSQKFSETGLEGEVLPFIDDMPAAFARADLVICRAGAGAVAELAAAGKPSILVPLPTAADQHQLRNAEAYQKAGAAMLTLDQEMDGGRLFEEVEKLRTHPELLQRMGERARAFSHPDAARRAATVLEEAMGRVSAGLEKQ